MKRCLITGSGGFIGSHLAEYLLKQGLEVWGLFHHRPVKDGQKGRLRYLQADVVDADAVSRAVAHAKPDTVFHLAARTLVQASWQEPEETLRTNILGTLNVLQAAAAFSGNPKIVIAGSSAEYGSREAGSSPLREGDQLQPASPYGYSKVAAELLGWLYWRTRGLKVVSVRPFAVIGTRKVSDVCSDMARGIVAVESGKSRGLAVGNLNSVRDFVDISDAIRALVLVAEQGAAGEAYNICSGAGYPISEIVERLRGLARVEVPLERNPEKLRPFDDPVLIGDNTKLCALGWRTTVSLDESLNRIITYWRKETDHREI